VPEAPETAAHEVILSHDLPTDELLDVLLERSEQRLVELGLAAPAPISRPQLRALQGGLVDVLCLPVVGEVALSLLT